MSCMLTNLKAIAVACRDSDVQNVKALIVGPPDTPYEFGFFEVRTVLGSFVFSDSLSVLSSVSSSLMVGGLQSNMKPTRR